MCRRSWERWESRVAEDIGGERVIGSGATDRFKGDVKSNDYLVECKWTGGNAYRLTATLWHRVSMWGRNEQRTPVVAIRAATGSAVVVPEWWWCERHPGADFGEQVMRKSKNIDPAMVADGPVGCRIGHERVVVASYGEFVECC